LVLFLTIRLALPKAPEEALKKQVLGPILDALMEFQSDACEKAHFHEIDSVLGLCKKVL
jgi:hypothetical protein